MPSLHPSQTMTPRALYRKTPRTITRLFARPITTIAPVQPQPALCSRLVRPPPTTAPRRTATTSSRTSILPTATPYSTHAMSAPPASAAPATAAEPVVHDVYEPRTGTLQYIVADAATKRCVIIDPVLDFDDATRSIATHSADALLALVQQHDYDVERILETHAHADHITAAAYLQSRLAQVQGHKPPVGIGKRITEVQQLFGERYRVVPAEYQTVFDVLFDDNETFSIGGLTATVMHLPGHTPDHLGYKIGDNVFCGDSLFNADIGTARCDFPGGNAADLFQSGRTLLALPGHTKIWTGHDYPPQERGAPVPWMTVDDHRAQNKHLRDGVSRDEFVALRRARDATLGEPRLLHQSLQINIRGGHFPQPTASGDRMLVMPFKLQSTDVQW